MGYIFECPECHTKESEYRGCMSTMMGWVPRTDENGVLINRDPNIREHFHLCKNGHQVTVKVQYDEVISCKVSSR